MSSPRGRWWDQRCTSVPRCLPLQFGSGSFYAGSHYNAGPPGLDLGHLLLPGSHRLGHLPLSPLQGLELHLDSQTGSEINSGLWVETRKKQPDVIEQIVGVTIFNLNHFRNFETCCVWHSAAIWWRAWTKCLNKPKTYIALLNCKEKNC